jgi:hypothetical protein
MQPMLDRARRPRAPRAPRPRSPALRRLSLAALALAVLAGVAGPAAAGPKKYHFELAAVTPKPEIKADVGKAAVPRVEGQLKQVLETHPQLVAKLEGAPAKDKADAFRKYLAQKGIAGAHLVTVEITEASEELEPMDKPNSQRFTVTIAVHILGETIPGRTISFTGDGRAKVKQEIGKKLRPRDREVAWDEAAKVAIDDAMKTVFQQLEKPTPPKKK